MIKEQRIGNKDVYLAEFGTGDVAIIPAATGPVPGRWIVGDDSIWLVQDEPRDEAEWDTDPMPTIKNTDELPAEPKPIVLKFNKAAGLAIFIKVCQGIYDGMHLEELANEKKLKALLEVKAINESGYAGVMPNGNIVDRRDYPEAVPVPTNPMFGIVEPKELPPPAERGAVL